MSSKSVPFVRTSGDGMENIVPYSSEINISKALLSRVSPDMLKSMKPVKPNSKVFNLVPKYIPRDKKKSNIILTKPKEPKFVPYEPYKAAVRPICPKPRRHSDLINKVNYSKNNIEIHELVEQMSEMRLKEMSKLKLANFSENEVIPRLQWEKEKKAYENDIKNLKETKAHLENQLKFQGQVNSELKTLLVAAVGEDLESRVQHLTEDKLSLARALLNSANHLTSHQEQTEWLSGQCEVWKSKFLASSLMVEELARWKSALTNRANCFQEVLKQMLNEHQHIQKFMLKTFNNLNNISEKQNETNILLKKGDVLELSVVNNNLSSQLASSYGALPTSEPEKYNALSPVGEVALKVLKSTISLSSQDNLCSALVDAAHTMTLAPNYAQSASLHPCCSHCKGEMQNI
ncbi:hypothetical protein GWI33_020238 [Rhynchophorus ferrugineus]|uniref:Golgin-45 n=1 Tax=Rhynchophorus ferrugineus TaxID=354439 RepID=A0A834HSR9_RHYFE|nr:hypothetical protein GWI33_020238 [Rhynchophorus ferrugineus]